MNAKNSKINRNNIQQVLQEDVYTLKSVFAAVRAYYQNLNATELLTEIRDLLNSLPGTHDNYKNLIKLYYEYDEILNRSSFSGHLD
jgi:hypothetical protein